MDMEENDRMDETLNNTSLFSICFAISLLTHRAQNELTDKRTKRKYEKFPRDIVTIHLHTMLSLNVDSLLVSIK